MIDIHICGICKTQFHDVDLFITHKRAGGCSAPLPVAESDEPASTKSSSKNSTTSTTKPEVMMEIQRLVSSAIETAGANMQQPTINIQTDAGNVKTISISPGNGEHLDGEADGSGADGTNTITLPLEAITGGEGISLDQLKAGGWSIVT